LKDNWVHALQMTYDYKDGILTFTDGVKYTIKEAVLLSKGKIQDHDLRFIHLIKKIFDGEIEDCFGRIGIECMPQHDRQVPTKIPVSSVRPVLQEYWCQGKPYVDPCQGVLNL